MPRIIASIAIAAALVAGAFIIKGREQNPAASPTALIAEQIQTANESALQTYAQELAASGVASDTAIIIPQPTSDVTSNPSTGSGQATPPTATDKLAQNVLETYVSAKGSGVDISSDVATQIADNVVSQNYTDSTSAKIYSNADIKTQNTSSISNIKNYGNSVGKIISTPPSSGEEFELDVFETFANSGNESVLSSLSLNIDRYQKMVSSLLNISAPTVFVQSHLALINSLSNIVFSIQKMQDAPTDPVGAVNATSDYETASHNLVSALLAEKAIFLKENIVFSSSESGYILTK